MTTLWVNTHFSQSLSAITRQPRSQLALIDNTVRNRATVVAIKGNLQFQPIHRGVAVVKPEVFFGLITGNALLDAVDFPDPYEAEGESQGWMYKHYFLGAAFGDGAQPVYWEQQNVDIDVRSKRRLKGIAQQTLFTFVDIKAVGDVSTLNIDLSILLNIA